MQGWKVVIGAAIAGVFALAGCAGQAPQSSSSPSAEAVPDTAGAVIGVPGDFDTIQAAVDAAVPGDMVLVEPGLYEEQVAIDTPGITLRGTDRDGVVIDGGVRRANGVVVTAGQVTVQNLTVQRATQNGVLVTGLRGENGEGIGNQEGYDRADVGEIALLDGFSIDHVTASNNGLYGIYAFHSNGGVIRDSYASGGADSGIYVGQCQPCNIVVQNNVAERNAVGFEIANAGGDLFVVGNRFAGNRVGATLNSDYQEAFVPQTGVTFAGNLVAANAQADSPEQADGGWGIGIGIAGGTENLVQSNLVQGNPTAGLILSSAEDLGPIDNRVVGNTFSSNGVDAAYTASARAPGSGTCFDGNSLATTSPADLVAVSVCPGGGALSVGQLPATEAPPGVPFTQVAAPPAQPQLADVETAPRPWQVADVPPVDLAAFTVPDASLLANRASITW